MTGWLVLEERRGRRAEWERSGALGLELLRVGIPAPEGLGERRLARRVEGAARRLAAYGVSRVLTQEDFCWWELLRVHGLRPVKTQTLCQALAAPLILAVLARQGTAPEEAVVELRGARVNRALFQAAERLCPRVRGLVVSAPSGGAELGRYLRERFGAAVLERPLDGPPHAAAWFSPGEGDNRALRLYGPAPDLLGLRPVPPWALPGQMDPLAAAALLWEAGALRAEEIKLYPAGPGRN